VVPYGVEREEENEEVARLRAALERHRPALCEALVAAMTERTFPPHPRFKRSTPPSLEDADALCGIHVIYCYPDWEPVIGGLSRAAAWKCGVRIPFNPRAEEALKRGAQIPFDSRLKDPWDDEPDGVFVVRAAERWIIDAWRAVRGVAPDLRGFMSEHDGGEMIDLDSGQVVPDDDVGMGPL
jgi:hypothetical protein